MGGLQDRTQRESSCQALHDIALGSQGLLMCPHSPTLNVPCWSLLVLQGGNSAQNPAPSCGWFVLGSQVSTWFQLPEVLIPRWSVSHCAPSLLFRPHVGPYDAILSSPVFHETKLKLCKIVDLDCLVHICIPRAEYLASCQMFVEKNH